MEDIHQSDKKPVKRRKVETLIPEIMTEEDKATQITQWSTELQGLFKYYNEVLHEKELMKEEDADSSLLQSLFVCLLEERSLPYSKLVEDIYQKLHSRDDITLASVQSLVLDVGQRLFYGIGKADADVLEDDTKKCLWCWETRNLKLIPEIHGGPLYIKWICRRKIHERITAVSDKLEYQMDVAKTSSETDIRLLVERMAQKIETKMEAKLKVKDLNKKLETKKREVEKEKRQTEKIILQGEKELKLLQEEAAKDAKRGEKEEGQMKKKIKRQQEEAEKHQRRQDKEVANHARLA